MKVKTSKFRIGMRVKFGGFVARVSEYVVFLETDSDKIRKLAYVEASKTKVGAFLGMIRQFEVWSPNLSCLSKNMKTLTNANMHFKWDEECQKEFFGTKEIVGNVQFLAPYDIRKPLELFTDASKERC